MPDGKLLAVKGDFCAVDQPGNETTGENDPGDHMHDRSQQHRNRSAAAQRPPVPEE